MACIYTLGHLNDAVVSGNSATTSGRTDLVATA